MKNVMTIAWRIYKTLTGDHLAKLRMALRLAWKELKEMDNTYSWTGNNGKEFKLVAEFKQYMVDEVRNSDGYEYSTGKKIVRTDSKLVAFADGKEVEVCRNINFWKIIDEPKYGCKRIWGINRIGFTAERASEIESFLNGVIEAGKTEEVKAFENAERAKRIAKELAYYERVVADAEKQKEIMTDKKRKTYMKRWNDIYNEGGEGYVPCPVCKEEYEFAMKKVAELRTAM